MESGEETIRSSRLSAVNSLAQRPKEAKRGRPDLACERDPGQAGRKRGLLDSSDRAPGFTELRAIGSTPEGALIRLVNKIHALGWWWDSEWRDGLKGD
jgi:hypothetical protein